MTPMVGVPSAAFATGAATDAARLWASHRRGGCGSGGCGGCGGGGGGGGAGGGKQQQQSRTEEEKRKNIHDAAKAYQKAREFLQKFFRVTLYAVLTSELVMPTMLLK